MHTLITTIASRTWSRVNQIVSTAAMQVILSRGLLIHVAALLDKAFRGHPNALLYFVMVMCPLCMNLVQVRPSV